MVLGRLTHYAFDALAISVVLAGVKKQTGFGYVPSFSLSSPVTSLPLLIRPIRLSDKALQSTARKD